MNFPTQECPDFPSLFVLVFTRHLPFWEVMPRDKTAVAFLFYSEARSGHSQVDLLILNTILQVRIYNI